MSRFFTAATLVSVAQALAFDGKPARATDAVVPDATFYRPEITSPPYLRQLLADDTFNDTVYVAPDNTCGYVDGRPGAPITCNSLYTCAIVIQSAIQRAGCCSSSDCGFRNTCYDSTAVFSSSICDGACLQDTFTVKCTDSTAPYCNTVTFFDGAIDFFCGSNNISSYQQLSTTWDGQTDATEWYTFIDTPTESGTESATDDGSFVIPTSLASSATGGSDESSTDSSDGDTGSSPTSGSGGSSSGNDNAPTEKKQSSTPIGPIVGGVVGGVAVLALVGFGIFFLVRHNKKKAAAAAAAAASTQPMQQTAAGGPGGMPSPPPPGAPGYPPQGGYPGPYDQHQNQYQNQNLYPQQQPSPQPYFPNDAQKPTGFVGMAPTAVPDRHDSTSPTSQFSDPRHSTQPHSPTSTLNNHASWTPQPGQPGQPMSPNVPPTVHEAGGNVVGERDYNANHRGQFHEMG